jgi:hypothetical protein
LSVHGCPLCQKGYPRQVHTCLERSRPVEVHLKCKSINQSIHVRVRRSALSHCRPAGRRPVSTQLQAVIPTVPLPLAVYTSVCGWMHMMGRPWGGGDSASSQLPSPCHLSSSAVLIPGNADATDPSCGCKTWTGPLSHGCQADAGGAPSTCHLVLPAAPRHPS